MYVIAAYDVDKKRDGKYLRLFKKYLFHAQNSLFLGELTQSEFNSLQKNINKLNNESDRLLLITVPKKTYLSILDYNSQDLYFVS
jgi:CRISPR-associated protein Cas2